jgi:hypothetical protein
MRTRLLTICGVLAVLLAVGVSAEGSTPSAALKAQKAKVAKLQAQLAKVKKTDAARIATLKGQVTTLTTANTQLTGQVATLTTQSTGLQGQVTTLNGQLAAGAAGGTAAIIAAGPAAEWTAVVSMWNVFPMLTGGAFCGFDKSSNIFGGTGLNITSYTFTDDTNC